MPQEVTKTIIIRLHVSGGRRVEGTNELTKGPPS